MDHFLPYLPRGSNRSQREQRVLTNVTNRLDSRLEFTESGLRSLSRTEGPDSGGSSRGDSDCSSGRVEQCRHDGCRVCGPRGGRVRRGRLNPILVNVFLSLTKLPPFNTSLNPHPDKLYLLADSSGLSRSNFSHSVA